MSLKERATAVVAKQLCQVCLYAKHQASELCKAIDLFKSHKACQFVHCAGLFGGHNYDKGLAACTAQTEVGDASIGGGALLICQSVPLRGALPIGVLYNTGANVSLVSRSYVTANQLSVVKKKVPLTVTLAMGKRQQLVTQAYSVPLLNKWGKEVSLACLNRPSKI